MSDTDRVVLCLHDGCDYRLSYTPETRDAAWAAVRAHEREHVREIERRAYNAGLDTAIRLVDETPLEKVDAETLVAGLEASKKSPKKQ